MISLKKFIIKKVSGDEKEAQFEIGPLPTGYGHTMGNILRRVLLSSVPGSAVTGIKLDGVEHEYSTLAGVSDDVLKVLLALKNVVVVSQTHDPVNLEIEVKGKKGEVLEVTAGDIEKSSLVEVMNPDYVITKLTDAKAKFKAQLTVERGTGYARAEEKKREEVSVIPVDANFSPVTHVNYEVVATRVGQETELDQVNLTVKTNGAVTPVEALHVSAEILNEMTSHLTYSTEQMLTGKEVTVLVGREPEVEEVEEEPEEEDKPLKVEDMGLSTRVTNALLRAGYEDLRTLDGLTEEEVLGIRGMGKKSFEALQKILDENDIKLV